MNKPIYILLLMVFLVSCNKGGSLFDNPQPEDTGITFTNTLTSTDDLSILDYLYFYNGGGPKNSGKTGTRPSSTSRSSHPS